MFNLSQFHFANDSQRLLSFKGGSVAVSHKAPVSPASVFIYCNEVRPTRGLVFFFSYSNCVSKDNIPHSISKKKNQIKRDFSVYTQDGMSKDSGRKRIWFQMEYQYVRKTDPSGRCGAGEQTSSQVICCRSTPTSFMVMAAISALSAATQHPGG